VTEASIAKVLFTFAEVADMTGLKESWLRRAVAQRTVAHRRVGKHVRFSHDDIAALIAASSQPVATATPIRRRKTA
jgi:excisionase family DNA binding protein